MQVAPFDENTQSADEAAKKEFGGTLVSHKSKPDTVHFPSYLLYRSQPATQQWSGAMVGERNDNASPSSFSKLCACLGCAKSTAPWSVGISVKGWVEG